MIDAQARLADSFRDPEVQRQADNAVALIRALATADVTALHALFVGHPDIDDPFHGRGVGAGAEEIARAWRPAHLATVHDVRLEHFAMTGGQSGAEVAVDLERPDGSRFSSKMLIVSRLEGELLASSRIYYRRAWIDGQQHSRLSVKENTVGHIGFNPLITRYQDTLRGGNLDEMVAVFSPDGYLDGHGESRILIEGRGMGLYEGREDVRYCLKQMFDIEGHGDSDASDDASVGEFIDHRNAFDDGRTTILEFVIVRPNDPNAPEQAGASAYELGDDGLLGASRIYDEGW